MFESGGVDSEISGNEVGVECRFCNLCVVIGGC